MNIYFISGLGADKRAFERLKLPDKYSIHYLDWISPLKNESLGNYAKRLAEPIDTSQPFAIVGLSMGGMIAIAMKEFLPSHKTILISSVGCINEFSGLLRFARFSRIYKLLPKLVLHHSNFVAYRMFGAKTKNEKVLLRHIILNSDPSFIKWGIGAILSWKNDCRPDDIHQIHGSNDKILPIKYTSPDVVVKDGSHFMVWTKAGEVSKLLTNALEKS